VTAAPRDGVVTATGKPVHVRRSGTPGRTPTAVVSLAMGSLCTDWDAVLALLPDADVILFDRPGTGHSPPPTPAWPDAPPPDLYEEVRRIGETARAVGARPPYVLVGHSSGGLHVQGFARLHPAETAGVVLIDSSDPEPTHRGRLRPGRGRVVRAASRSSLPGVLGPRVRRVLVWAQTDHAGDPLPPPERNRIFGSPAVARAVFAEYLTFPALADQLAALAGTHPFPEIPTAVLVAGSTGRPLRRSVPAPREDDGVVGRPITGGACRVDGAAHMVPLDRPDAVADAIRAVLHASTG
jgi:pimeloyl-ACP methyl ester carboxylesterase